MDGELAALLPALAEAARTVGSPQIRNRGTIGGNLATASPAGDAMPPLLIEGAEVECASRAREPARAARRVRHRREAERARARRADHRRLAHALRRPQTFMKVGPRNAMVIAVVSLALAAGDELRASFGSAGRVRCWSPRRAPRRRRSPSGSRPRPRRSTTCAGRRLSPPRPARARRPRARADARCA